MTRDEVNGMDGKTLRATARGMGITTANMGNDVVREMLLAACDIEQTPRADEQTVSADKPVPVVLDSEGTVVAEFQGTDRGAVPVVPAYLRHAQALAASAPTGTATFPAYDDPGFPAAVLGAYSRHAAEYRAKGRDTDRTDSDFATMLNMARALPFLGWKAVAKGKGNVFPSGSTIAPQGTPRWGRETVRALLASLRGT